MVKPYSLRELISRVRALLRRAYGELAMPSLGEKMQFDDLEIDLERLQVRKSGRSLSLTPTEFRLLRYMAIHPERPFARSELIEAVWGYDSELVSDRTVDVHVRHLRQKLEENPTDPRWIATVRGVGYMFQP